MKNNNFKVNISKFFFRFTTRTFIVKIIIPYQHTKVHGFYFNKFLLKNSFTSISRNENLLIKYQ